MSMPRWFVLAGCLVAPAVVIAQQSDRPGQTPQRESEQRQPGGQGESTTGRESAGQRGGANAGGAQQGAQSQVENHFVKCLIQGNQGEIAMGRVAAQRASSREVKAFAEQMVKEHTDMLSQLQQFAPGQGGSNAESNSQSSPRSLDDPSSRRGTGQRGTGQGTSGQDASGQGTSGQGTSGQGQRGSNPANAGQRGTGQGAAGQGTTGQGNAGQSQTEAGQSGQGQSGAGQGTRTQDRTGAEQAQDRAGLTQGSATDRSHASAASGSELQTVSRITEEIGKRCLASNLEELESKKGEEFDKCYMGIQVMEHQKMADELAVLKNNVQSAEVRQLITQGSETTMQHLEHAKSIMKTLDKGTTGSAQRDKTAEQERR